MGGGSFSVFIRIWSRLQFCSGACPSANSSSVMPSDQMSALQSYLPKKTTDITVSFEEPGIVPQTA